MRPYLMARILRATAPIVLLGLTFPAQAQLEWDATEIHHIATDEELAYNASFSFVNAGTTAIEVTETRTSCGCTVAKLTKKTYQPGERGEITATFTYGDRTGGQKKTIHVRTSHPDQANVALTLHVDVPEAVKIEGGWVWWRGKAERHNPKTIRIEVLQDEPIEVELQETRYFDVVLDASEDGRQMEIQVVPKESAPATGNDSLRITTTAKSVRAREILIPLTLLSDRPGNPPVRSSPSASTRRNGMGSNPPSIRRQALKKEGEPESAGDRPEPPIGSAKIVPVQKETDSN